MARAKTAIATLVLFLLVAPCLGAEDAGDTPAQIKYQVVKRQDISHATARRMAYRVLLQVKDIPTERAMRHLVQTIWKSGNQGWDVFTVWLYLPDMDTNSLAYVTADFRPTGLKEFRVSSAALYSTRWHKKAKSAKLKGEITDSAKTIDALEAENKTLKETIAKQEQIIATLRKEMKTLKEKLAKDPADGAGKTIPFPPLQFVKATMGTDVLGQPTVKVLVKNVSSQPVIAYTVGIYCYDRFDEPVKGLLKKTNLYRGISQRTVASGATGGDDSYWTLTFHDNTAKVKVVLERVRLADGTDWQTGNNAEMTIKAESKK